MTKRMRMRTATTELQTMAMMAHTDRPVLRSCSMATELPPPDSSGARDTSESGLTSTAWRQGHNYTESPWKPTWSSSVLRRAVSMRPPSPPARAPQLPNKSS
ncbi:hypothetical protein EYF80_047606 [Liparis tanakae]|uniref:Uncharacterized protein n=1 Tax=Liparis tanakae TaxID=230148 RepID=A0A4Z2FMI6_9TELE|nr:hypothetical protein EYF80_047606 [Liparis tanakae]